MKEIWKLILSLDGIYEASNLGRIKSNNFYNKKVPKILSLVNNGNGYLYFTISINNKRRNVYVHRAVCEAFNPTIDGMNIVNHKNGLKNDNRVENLEWNTYSENTLHAFKHGLMKNANGENQHLSKLKEKDVLDIRKNEYNLSYRKLAIKYNVSTYAIYSVLKNKTWKHI